MLKQLLAGALVAALAGPVACAPEGPTRPKGPVVAEASTEYWRIMISATTIDGTELDRATLCTIAGYAGEKIVIVTDERGRTQPYRRSDEYRTPATIRAYAFEGVERIEVLCEMFGRPGEILFMLVQAPDGSTKMVDEIIETGDHSVIAEAKIFVG